MQAGFIDIFKAIKVRENAAALALLPEVCWLQLLRLPLLPQAWLLLCMLNLELAYKFSLRSALKLTVYLMQCSDGRWSSVACLLG